MSLTPPPVLDLPQAIDGPRVRLRPYRAEDAAAVWEAVQASRAHLSAWLPWALHYSSIEDARAFVRQARERFLSGDDLTVGIFDQADDRFLGGSGLHRINWVLRSFEIGYWLRRDAEGRGYMHETVLLLTRFAFEDLAANRVAIRMDTRNDRSRLVAERAGYRREGTLRRCALDSDNQPSDRHIYALIPEDYAGLRAQVHAELAAGRR